ncbi:MAG TPA: hypothetical protein VJB60_04340, partial [Candidatus Peribacterales bacterium]|nr:hypothetical protein [Candidatus Peribacterales bacterium]
MLGIFTLLLVGCSSDAPPAPATIPLPQVQSTTLPPITPVIGAVPMGWTVTGSTSLYARLYQSSNAVLETSLLLPSDTDAVSDSLIADRIITAVAADLVVQYYTQGTKPLEERANDLVVWRTNDLAPIPTEAFDLGKDGLGVPYEFNEVKQFVRDAINETTDIACLRTPPWWLHPEKPTRLPESGTMDMTPAACSLLIDEVREAVERERMLEALRQDLSLIAYGEEFIVDGDLQASPKELRTYDLLLDIAGAGNILGAGAFDVLFQNGNQGGEQCDHGVCACTYPFVPSCGDGIKQGGMEQCDDHNKYPGDGCDEFCQVEQNYCGDTVTQHWEECGEERECPDGAACGSYADCAIGGSICGGGLSPTECQNQLWEKTCRFTGQTCGINNPENPDQDCTAVPSFLLGKPQAQIDLWRRDACRYVAGGVCFVGQPGSGIIEGTPCKDQADCSGVSSCTSEGFCTNHPYRTCKSDEQCYSCSSEEIKGTCYENGESCNGNEDCPISGYCMLEPEGICRPRVIGGMGNDRSTCNEFCEDKTRCGDRVIYLTENGNPEECDNGMHCADGSQCFLGQVCEDGSACKPRDGVGAGLFTLQTWNTCTALCKLQICGDGIT